MIAAHPDDECLGAAGLLDSPGRHAVLHLTDGVPRDRRFWPARAPHGPAIYARQRRDEALRALSLAGVADDDVHSLGLVALELCYDLVDVSRAVARRIEQIAPQRIVTHAYEGGDPDHDAAAFAVAAARALLDAGGGHPVPPCFEMALYHGAAGRMVTGDFVPPDLGAHPEVTRELCADQLDTKRSMLRCFISQADVLRPFFSLRHERYRPAPRYDFSRPPHAGPLLYERTQLGAGPTGALWRELAGSAARQLALPAARPAGGARERGEQTRRPPPRAGASQPAATWARAARACRAATAARARRSAQQLNRAPIAFDRSHVEVDVPHPHSLQP